jgi:hypothetical protein
MKFAHPIFYPFHFSPFYLHQIISLQTPFIPNFSSIRMSPEIHINLRFPSRNPKRLLQSTHEPKPQP